jgi:hypothetical protein
MIFLIRRVVKVFLKKSTMSYIYERMDYGVALNEIYNFLVSSFSIWGI